MRVTETVIGRARLGPRIVLLTDAPALLTVDVEREAITRRPLGGSAVSRLWGLAEHAGRLFSISGFDTLVEIDASGAFVEVARLRRPVLNLIDLDGAMAVQLAGESAGAPLLASLDPSGAIASFSSPLRAALGLTPPEEGVLHLLSCSVPPVPVCWLPGDVRVFTADARALVLRTRVQGLSPPDAAILIASPERRLLEDALRLDDEGLLALRRIGNADEQRLTRYSVEGVPLGEKVPRQPLRLLLEASPRGVLAVARTGRLVMLEKP